MMKWHYLCSFLGCLSSQNMMVRPYPTAPPALTSMAAPPHSPSGPHAPTSAARETAQRWVFHVHFRLVHVWHPSSRSAALFLALVSWQTMRPTGSRTRSLRWAWVWALQQPRRRWRSTPKKRRRRRKWTGWKNTSSSVISETLPFKDTSESKRSSHTSLLKSDLKTFCCHQSFACDIPTYGKMLFLYFISINHKLTFSYYLFLWTLWH